MSMSMTLLVEGHEANGKCIRCPTQTGDAVWRGPVRSTLHGTADWPHHQVHPLYMYTYLSKYTIPPDQAASIDLTVSRHDSRVLYAN